MSGVKQYQHGESADVPLGQAALGQAPDGTVKALQVDNSGNLKTSVTGAGSGGTSSVDKSTFTAGTSAGTPAMGVVAPVDTPPAGDLAIVALDANRNLCVNVKAGGGSGGTSSGFSAAFPATGTAAGASDGTNMKPLLVDGSGNLKVNVVAGGSGGGAVTVADGADIAEGATTDAAITTDVAGTLSAKLRGLVKILGSVWSSANNWLQVAIQNATLANPLRIDPTGTTTQPVSGAVTANVGTTNGLALDATLTGGSQKSKLVDAAGTNQASVSAAGALKVDGSAVTQPVSGAVTANAGTNLNTSALALESGGNLATLAGAVSGAKVQENLAQIGGNAVSAGAGNVNTGTQRIVQGTGSTFNTGQVSVGATPTLILAANPSRISITVINNGTTDVFIGGSGVTPTTGQLLVGIKGYPMKIRSSAAIYGIVGSGTQTVSYLEEVQ